MRPNLKKTNLTFPNFSPQKDWIKIVWLLITATTIGFLIGIFYPFKYEARTEFLLLNAEDSQSKILAYVLPRSQFFEMVKENNEIILDKKLLTTEQWRKNVQAKLRVDNNILELKIKGENKKDTLKTAELTRQKFLEKYPDFLENKNSPFEIKIVDQTKIISLGRTERTLYFISFAIFGALVLILTLTLLSLRRNFKPQNNYWKRKRYYRKKRNKKRPLMPQPKKKESTENEVKEKLNRLIRGENIFGPTKKIAKKH